MSTQPISPVHPGQYLREILEELGISQYRLAKALGVPAMRINHIVHGRRPVTADMALRLGLFFDQSPQFWMNLQTRYDLDVARDAMGDRLAKEIEPLAAA
jgi:addiction module HigA family antidote